MTPNSEEAIKALEEAQRVLLECASEGPRGPVLYRIKSAIGSIAKVLTTPPKPPVITKGKKNV